MTVARDDLARPIRLLVRLLRQDVAGIRGCLEEKEALDELALVALNGGLSVVLLQALATSGLTQLLSEERQVALADRRNRQAKRYATLAKGLVRVANLFETSGVPFMLLKGPYLAARFYGDPQGREFVDIDLLVPRARRGRAFSILDEAGFSRRSRIIGSEAFTTFFVHGFDFVAEGVNLDLHWSLSRHPSFAMDESRIWEGQRVFALGERSYAVLSDADEVTFGALALLRDIARGRPKVKNVVDLIQVVATIDPTMAWDELFASAPGDGTYGPLVNVLSLCLDVADAHDLTPRLAATLGHHAHRVRPVAVGGPLSASSAPTRFADTLWAARAHDAALANWLAWWVVSLPFRRAVHGWRRPVTGRPNVPS